MKKLDIIISIAVLIWAVYMGFTLGMHGRAIKRLSKSDIEQYSVDSVLFGAIKSVDSLMWRGDSVLMEGFLLLNERMDKIEKTK